MYKLRPQAPASPVLGGAIPRNFRQSRKFLGKPPGVSDAGTLSASGDFLGCLLQLYSLLCKLYSCRNFLGRVERMKGDFSLRGKITFHVVVFLGTASRRLLFGEGSSTAFSLCEKRCREIDLGQLLVDQGQDLFRWLTTVEAILLRRGFLPRGSHVAKRLRAVTSPRKFFAEKSCKTRFFTDFIAVGAKSPP